MSYGMRYSVWVFQVVARQNTSSKTEHERGSVEKVKRDGRHRERSKALEARSLSAMTAGCNNKRCKLNHSCKRFDPDTDTRFFPVRLRNDKRFCVMYIEKSFED